MSHAYESHHLKIGSIFGQVERIEYDPRRHPRRYSDSQIVNFFKNFQNKVLKVKNGVLKTGNKKHKYTEKSVNMKKKKVYHEIQVKF